MKRKVVLGMAVFMTAIMVPAQAFAAKLQEAEIICPVLRKLWKAATWM